MTVNLDQLQGDKGISFFFYNWKIEHRIKKICNSKVKRVVLSNLYTDKWYVYDPPATQKSKL